MKNICSILSGFLMLGGACFAATASAQEYRQPFGLAPGWNAIYLEVDPNEKNPGLLLTNLPVESVWTFSQKETVTEFFSDASQPIGDTSKWLRWFPSNTPESRFNTLFAITPNRSYLIKMAGETNRPPVQLEIVGKVAATSKKWAANAFTLRGLPCDDVQPPSFANYFRNSPAHFAAGKLQTIYSLQSSGQWNKVLMEDVMQRGKAYWIYTKGTSSFAGGFAFADGQNDGLAFGLDITTITLEATAVNDAPRTLTFRNLALDNPPLSVYQIDLFQRVNNFTPLPSIFSRAFPQGGKLQLRIKAERGALPSPSYQTVYEVRDEQGTLQRIPVSINRGI